MEIEGLIVAARCRGIIQATTVDGESSISVLFNALSDTRLALSNLGVKLKKSVGVGIALFLRDGREDFLERLE